MPKQLTYRAAVQAALELWDRGEYAKAVDAWLAAADTVTRYSPDPELCERFALEAFNRAYRPGIKVRYWPGLRKGEGREGITRGEAYMLAGTAMVPIAGVAGGIALTHVEVLAETEAAGAVE